MKIRPFVSTRETELRLDCTPVELCGRLRAGQEASLLLDGAGDFDSCWATGPLVAVDPRVVKSDLASLDARIGERRAAGGSAGTGVAVLLGYESQALALAVDRTVRFLGEGRAVWTDRAGDRRLPEDRIDAVVAPGVAARAVGSPRTSLPRDRYLEAVRRVKRHITLGDVYQANLCQRFEAAYEGDEHALYEALATRTEAPFSAFVEAPGVAIASVSPERFLRIGADGAIGTWPIKGTRPRGATPERDIAAASGLMESAKDRAELLMIVDLERNDLSRICRAGSVRVPELVALRTFAAVHHLVAHVEGRLRDGVGVADVIRATFPGGSITGAPKLRSMEILRELEPVPRGYFTGSLFWFGDDGTLDSNILIRTLELRDGCAHLGAGGGIVADSDPEQEWLESNHKARALAQTLGFEPEEAT